MSKYNSEEFTPPARVTEVEVRLLPRYDDTSVRVLLQIDTGADLTVLPSKPLERVLGLEMGNAEVYHLVGIGGNIIVAKAVEVEITILDKIYSGRYLAIDEPYGLLGRDILNDFALVFDGPNQTWRELTKRET